MYAKAAYVVTLRAPKMSKWRTISEFQKGSNCPGLNRTRTIKRAELKRPGGTAIPPTRLSA